MTAKTKTAAKKPTGQSAAAFKAWATRRSNARKAKRSKK